MLYWNNTTPSALSCLPMSQPTSGLNFGMQQIANVHEVEVHCPNWGAKPGQLEPMPITYQNNGTSIESDTITFVMDSLYTFVNANPAPSSVNGQTIQWAYSNLAPGQHGYIMVHVMPSLSAVLGDTLYSTVTMGPLNDTLPSNNIVNLHQLVSLAWDPNEKNASPAGEIDPGTEITYTIHFQNTGNATADNVTVVDTIDSDLDLLSFRLLGSSHNVNVTTEGAGIIHFTFYNIQLPDSGADFAGSNGYVSFALRARNTLPAGAELTNRAGIIFDQNVPVMTNTTLNSIRMTTGVNVLSKGGSLVAWPNPTSNNILFAFSDKANDKASLEVRSLDGKVVMIKNDITSFEPVSVASLSPGIYICLVVTKQNSYTVKVVKQ